MELTKTVQERRSIRRYKPEPVPRALIEEILTMARWAPSGGNMQSWKFTVLTGEPLARFKAANARMTAEKAKPEPDIPMSATMPEDVQRRYMEFMSSMLGIIGVKREDKEARAGVYQSMADLFDAQCLIVAAIPKSMSPEYPMFDLGLITQTICLLAYERGLGTLIMFQAIMFPSMLREVAVIPEDQRIVAGIALGWPQADAPVNNFIRTRLPLDDFVRWVGLGLV